MTNHSPVVLKVSTSDRAAMAQELIQHRRAGRLDQAEFDARLALAAAAVTEDQLRSAALDLPDPAVPQQGHAPSFATPGPDRQAMATLPVAPPPAPRHEVLGIFFDVTLMLLTMAAFVCTALVFAVTSGWMRTDERVVMSLAAFGSFTVGAGVTHLTHRLFRRTHHRG